MSNSEGQDNWQQLHLDPRKRCFEDNGQGQTVLLRKEVGRSEGQGWETGLAAAEGLRRMPDNPLASKHNIPLKFDDLRNQSFNLTLYNQHYRAS